VRSKKGRPHLTEKWLTQSPTVLVPINSFKARQLFCSKSQGCRQISAGHYRENDHGQGGGSINIPSMLIFTDYCDNSATD
jgi:hypothetical protein